MATGRFRMRSTPNMQQIPRRPSAGAINELMELSGLPRGKVIRMLANALREKHEH